MIRRLRRSFVRVTMISAALVLIVLMGLVNIMNYVQRDRADRSILTTLAENDGHLPTDGRFRGQRLSAGELYGASYYTVSLNAAGQILFIDSTQAPWIDTEAAAAAAQSLQAAGRTDGTWGDAKFTTAVRGTDVMYIFLAWSQNMASVRSFIYDSLIVTGLGLLVLFGLAWLLSNRAVRPIAESYEKQKSFITNAGHELKTPLAVIQSSADVIELESGETQWTKTIHSQVERLTALTGELTALARMDEGTALVLGELDLSDTVAQALAPFALLAEQNGHSFLTEIAPGIRLSSNAEAVRKLCGILADNAVKYASPGGDIRFTLSREGGHVLLRAENPAEGLAPGRQERLFDRFYRGDESRSSETPGYGLGLSLARSLAVALGGSLEAVSPDGKRLIFTVKFT